MYKNIFMLMYMPICLERLAPHFQNANATVAINCSKHNLLNPEICSYLTNLCVYRVILNFILFEEIFNYILILFLQIY